MKVIFFLLSFFLGVKNMLKFELHLLGKKYADYYQGRYSNAIITRKSVYWLDTDINSHEFHKGLMKYILNEGKEDFIKGVNDVIKKQIHMKKDKK